MTYLNINKKLWKDELAATYRLAWPLILVQLLHTSLGATDVIMMGWLGPKYIAAGGAASSFYFTITVFGMGTVGAVAPLIAQAIGAKDYTAVRRSLRQGIWVAILLACVSLLILLQSNFIFGVFNQKPETIILAGSYLDYAAWSVFPTMLLVAFRSFLSAHNDTKVILYITILSFFLNMIGNYGLMFGNFGLPKLELVGAGIATTAVQFASTGLLILYTLLKKHYRHYEILVRFWRPDWQKFFEIFKIGGPIGFTIMSEVGLFSAAYFLMGLLSIEEVAGHAIALQIASITFMLPFGLSFATTVRVGLAQGQGSKQGVYYAGWVSIILAFMLMLLTCILFIAFPNQLVALFLDPSLSSNKLPIALAVSYLAIAAAFQLFDGVQVACAGALRGLSDTKVPMLFAFISYWVVGMPISYLLAFEFELRGVGVWIGLASGLAFAAIILLIRFINREKYGLVKPVNYDN